VTKPLCRPRLQSSTSSSVCVTTSCTTTSTWTCKIKFTQRRTIAGWSKLQTEMKSGTSTEMVKRSTGGLDGVRSTGSLEATSGS
jgi:hypothetical protein